MKTKKGIFAGLILSILICVSALLWHTQIIDNFKQNNNGKENVAYTYTSATFTTTSFNGGIKLERLIDIAAIEFDSGSTYGIVDIPSVIDGKSVTAVDKIFDQLSASDKASINEVRLPKTIQSMAPAVFASLLNLNSITIPYVGTTKPLTAEGTENNTLGILFDYSNGDTKNESLFYSNLTDPSAVTYYQAEYGNLSGTSQTVSNHYFAIPTALETVNVNGSNLIADRAFMNMGSLKNVNVSFASDFSMGLSTFYQCSSLEKVSLPYMFLESTGAVGSYTFYGCKNLTTVVRTIPGADGLYPENGENDPDGIVSLPINLKIITESMFFGCESMTSIKMPVGLQAISNYAFQGCKGLTNLSKEYNTIPSELSTIGNFAFKNCSNLQNVVVPQNVTYIAMGAFAGCSGITSISLPFVGTISGIDENDYKNNLFGIIFAGDETQSGISVSQTYFEYHLEGDKKVYDLDRARNNLGYLDTLQVYLPYNLTTIYITNDKEIASGAFSELRNIKSVSILADKEKNADNLILHKQIFVHNVSLQHVTVPFIGNKLTPDITTTNIGYIFQHKVLDVAVDQIVEVNGNINYDTRAVSYYVPETLTSVEVLGINNILPYSFSGMKYLTQVKIGDGDINEIGANILQGCSSLQDLSVPFIGINRLAPTDDPTTGGTYRVVDYHLGIFFGEESFDNSIAVNLGTDTVYLPADFSKLTITGSAKLMSQALKNINTLKELNITFDITKLDNYAFSYGFLQGCSSLETLKIPFLGSTPAQDGTSFSNAPYLGYAFGSTNYQNSYPVQSNVAGNTFTSYIPFNLSSVTIYYGKPLGDGTASVPYGMFDGVYTLNNVVVPTNITKIEPYAFKDTSITNLDFISYNKNIKINSIGDYAFSNTKLSALYLDKANPLYPFSPLSDAKLYVGNYVFSNIESLNTVVLGDAITNLGYATGNILNPIGETESGVGLFSGCSNLSNLDINGATLTTNLFKDCSSISVVDLKNVNAEASNYKIPDGVFQNCSNLQGINFGDQYNTIGSYAFSGCSSLYGNLIPGGTTSADIPATNFALPSSLTTIETNAFEYCSKFNYLTIPAGLVNIGGGNFKDMKESFYLEIYALPKGTQHFVDNWHCGYPVHILNQKWEDIFTYEITGVNTCKITGVKANQTVPLNAAGNILTFPDEISVYKVTEIGIHVNENGDVIDKDGNVLNATTIASYISSKPTIKIIIFNESLNNIDDETFLLATYENHIDFCSPREASSSLGYFQNFQYWATKGRLFCSPTWYIESDALMFRQSAYKYDFVTTSFEFDRTYHVPELRDIRLDCLVAGYTDINVEKEIPELTYVSGIPQNLSDFEVTAVNNFNATAYYQRDYYYSHYWSYSYDAFKRSSSFPKCIVTYDNSAVYSAPIHVAQKAVNINIIYHKLYDGSGIYVNSAELNNPDYNYTNMGVINATMTDSTHSYHLSGHVASSYSKPITRTYRANYYPNWYYQHSERAYTRDFSFYFRVDHTYNLGNGVTKTYNETMNFYFKFNFVIDIDERQVYVGPDVDENGALKTDENGEVLYDTLSNYYQFVGGMPRMTPVAQPDGSILYEVQYNGNKIIPSLKQSALQQSSGLGVNYGFNQPNLTMNPAGATDLITPSDTIYTYTFSLHKLYYSYSCNASGGAFLTSTYNVLNNYGIYTQPDKSPRVITPVQFKFKIVKADIEVNIQQNYTIPISEDAYRLDLNSYASGVHDLVGGELTIAGLGVNHKISGYISSVFTGQTDDSDLRGEYTTDSSKQKYIVMTFNNPLSRVVDSAGNNVDYTVYYNQIKLSDTSMLSITYPYIDYDVWFGNDVIHSADIDSNNLDFYYNGEDNLFKIVPTSEQVEESDVVYTGELVGGKAINKLGEYELSFTITHRRYENTARTFLLRYKRRVLLINPDKLNVVYDGYDYENGYEDDFKIPTEALYTADAPESDPAKFVKLDWLVPADQITTRYTLEDTNEQLWEVPLNAGTYGLAFHADQNNYYEHIDGVFTFTIAKRKIHITFDDGVGDPVSKPYDMNPESFSISSPELYDSGDLPDVDRFVTSTNLSTLYLRTSSANAGNYNLPDDFIMTDTPGGTTPVTWKITKRAPNPTTLEYEDRTDNYEIDMGLGYTIKQLEFEYTINGAGSFAYDPNLSHQVYVDINSPMINGAYPFVYYSYDGGLTFTHDIRSFTDAGDHVIDIIIDEDEYDLAVNNNLLDPALNITQNDNYRSLHLEVHVDIQPLTLDSSFQLQFSEKTIIFDYQPHEVYAEIVYPTNLTYQVYYIYDGQISSDISNNMYVEQPDINDSRWTQTRSSFVDVGDYYVYYKTVVPNYTPTIGIVEMHITPDALDSSEVQVNNYYGDYIDGYVLQHSDINPVVVLRENPSNYIVYYGDVSTVEELDDPANVTTTIDDFGISNPGYYRLLFKIVKDGYTVYTGVWTAQIITHDDEQVPVTINPYETQYDGTNKAYYFDSSITPSFAQDYVAIPNGIDPANINMYFASADVAPSTNAPNTAANISNLNGYVINGYWDVASDFACIDPGVYEVTVLVTATNYAPALIQTEITIYPVNYGYELFTETIDYDGVVLNTDSQGKVTFPVNDVDNEYDTTVTLPISENTYNLYFKFSENSIYENSIIDSLNPPVFKFSYIDNEFNRVENYYNSASHDDYDLKLNYQRAGVYYIDYEITCENYSVGFATYHGKITLIVGKPKLNPYVLFSDSQLDYDHKAHSVYMSPDDSPMGPSFLDDIITVTKNDLLDFRIGYRSDDPDAINPTDGRYLTDLDGRQTSFYLSPVSFMDAGAHKLELLALAKGYQPYYFTVTITINKIEDVTIHVDEDNYNYTGLPLGDKFIKTSMFGDGIGHDGEKEYQYYYIDESEVMHKLNLNYEPTKLGRYFVKVHLKEGKNYLAQDISGYINIIVAEITLDYKDTQEYDGRDILKNFDYKNLPYLSDDEYMAVYQVEYDKLLAEGYSETEIISKLSLLHSKMQILSDKTVKYNGVLQPSNAQEAIYPGDYEVTLHFTPFGLDGASTDIFFTNYRLVDPYGGEFIDDTITINFTITNRNITLDGAQTFAFDGKNKVIDDWDNMLKDSTLGYGDEINLSLQSRECVPGQYLYSNGDIIVGNSSNAIIKVADDGQKINVTSYYNITFGDISIDIERVSYNYSVLADDGKGNVKTVATYDNITLDQSGEEENRIINIKIPFNNQYQRFYLAVDDIYVPGITIYYANTPYTISDPELSLQYVLGSIHYTNNTSKDENHFTPSFKNVGTYVLTYQINYTSASLSAPEKNMYMKYSGTINFEITKYDLEVQQEDGSPLVTEKTFDYKSFNFSYRLVDPGYGGTYPSYVVDSMSQPLDISYHQTQKLYVSWLTLEDLNGVEKKSEYYPDELSSLHIKTNVDGEYEQLNYTPVHAGYYLLHVKYDVTPLFPKSDYLRNLDKYILFTINKKPISVTFPENTVVDHVYNRDFKTLTIPNNYMLPTSFYGGSYPNPNFIISTISSQIGVYSASNRFVLIEPKEGLYTSPAGILSYSTVDPAAPDAPRVLDTEYQPSTIDIKNDVTLLITNLTVNITKGTLDDAYIPDNNYQFTGLTPNDLIENNPSEGKVIYTFYKVDEDDNPQGLPLPYSPNGVGRYFVNASVAETESYYGRDNITGYFNIVPRTVSLSDISWQESELPDDYGFYATGMQIVPEAYLTIDEKATLKTTYEARSGDPNAVGQGTYKAIIDNRSDTYPEKENMVYTQFEMDEKPYIISLRGIQFEDQYSFIFDGTKKSKVLTDYDVTNDVISVGHYFLPLIVSTSDSARGTYGFNSDDSTLTYHVTVEAYNNFFATHQTVNKKYTFDEYIAARGLNVVKNPDDTYTYNQNYMILFSDDNENNDVSGLYTIKTLSLRIYEPQIEFNIDWAYSEDYRPDGAKELVIDRYYDGASHRFSIGSGLDLIYPTVGYTIQYTQLVDGQWILKGTDGIDFKDVGEYYFKFTVTNGLSTQANSDYIKLIVHKGQPQLSVSNLSKVYDKTNMTANDFMSHFVNDAASVYDRDNYKITMYDSSSNELSSYSMLDGVPSTTGSGFAKNVGNYYVVIECQGSNNYEDKVFNYTFSITKRTVTLTSDMFDNTELVWDESGTTPNYVQEINLGAGTAGLLGADSAYVVVSTPDASNFANPIDDMRKTYNVSDLNPVACYTDNTKSTVANDIEQNYEFAYPEGFNVRIRYKLIYIEIEDDPNNSLDSYDSNTRLYTTDFNGDYQLFVANSYLKAPADRVGDANDNTLVTTSYYIGEMKIADPAHYFIMPGQYVVKVTSEAAYYETATKFVTFKINKAPLNIAPSADNSITSFFKEDLSFADSINEMTNVAITTFADFNDNSFIRGPFFTGINTPDLVGYVISLETGLVIQTMKINYNASIVETLPAGNYKLVMQTPETDYYAASKYEEKFSVSPFVFKLSGTVNKIYNGSILEVNTFTGPSIPTGLSVDTPNPRFTLTGRIYTPSANVGEYKVSSVLTNRLRSRLYVYGDGNQTLDLGPNFEVDMSELILKIIPLTVTVTGFNNEIHTPYDGTNKAPVNFTVIIPPVNGSIPSYQIILTYNDVSYNSRSSFPSLTQIGEYEITLNITGANLQFAKKTCHLYIEKADTVVYGLDGLKLDNYKGLDVYTKYYDGHQIDFTILSNRVLDSEIKPVISFYTWDLNNLSELPVLGTTQKLESAPVNAGGYILVASYPESTHYNAHTKIIHIIIKQADLSFVWEAPGKPMQSTYVYQNIVFAPKPYFYDVQTEDGMVRYVMPQFSGSSYNYYVTGAETVPVDSIDVGSYTAKVLLTSNMQTVDGTPFNANNYNVIGDTDKFVYKIIKRKLTLEVGGSMTGNGYPWSNQVWISLGNGTAEDQNIYGLCEGHEFIGKLETPSSDTGLYKSNSLVWNKDIFDSSVYGGIDNTPEYLVVDQYDNDKTSNYYIDLSSVEIEILNPAIDVYCPPVEVAYDGTQHLLNFSVPFGYENYTVYYLLDGSWTLESNIPADKFVLPNEDGYKPEYKLVFNDVFDTDGNNVEVTGQGKIIIHKIDHILSATQSATFTYDGNSITNDGFIITLDGQGNYTDPSVTYEYVTEVGYMANGSDVVPAIVMAENPKNAGKYVLRISIPSSDIYTSDYIDIPFEINKRDITINIGNPSTNPANTKMYDGDIWSAPISDYSADINNLVSGEVLVGTIETSEMLSGTYRMGAAKDLLIVPSSDPTESAVFDNYNIDIPSYVNYVTITKDVLDSAKYQIYIDGIELSALTNYDPTYGYVYSDGQSHTVSAAIVDPTLDSSQFTITIDPNTVSAPGSHVIDVYITSDSYTILDAYGNPSDHESVKITLSTGTTPFLDVNFGEDGNSVMYDEQGIGDITDDIVFADGYDGSDITITYYKKDENGDYVKMPDGEIPTDVGDYKVVLETDPTPLFPSPYFEKEFSIVPRDVSATIAQSIFEFNGTNQSPDTTTITYEYTDEDGVTHNPTIGATIVYVDENGDPLADQSSAGLSVKEGGYPYILVLDDPNYNVVPNNFVTIISKAPVASTLDNAIFVYSNTNHVPKKTDPLSLFNSNGDTIYMPWDIELDGVTEAINAGEYDVKMTMKPEAFVNYYWADGDIDDPTILKSFVIQKLNLADAELILYTVDGLGVETEIASIEDQTFSGIQITPEINVKARIVDSSNNVVFEQNLIEQNASNPIGDYILTYGENINVGDEAGTITIDATDDENSNFVFSKTFKFNITESVLRIIDSNDVWRFINLNYTDGGTSVIRYNYAPHTAYDPATPVYLTYVENKLLIQDFINQFDPVQIPNIVIFDNNNNIVDASEYSTKYIGTDYLVTLYNPDKTDVVDQVKVSIIGDVDSDGLFALSDLNTLKENIFNGTYTSINTQYCAGLINSMQNLGTAIEPVAPADISDIENTGDQIISATDDYNIMKDMLQNVFDLFSQGIHRI